MGDQSNWWNSIFRNVKQRTGIDLSKQTVAVENQVDTTSLNPVPPSAQAEIEVEAGQSEKTAFDEPDEEGAIVMEAETITVGRTSSSGEESSATKNKTLSDSQNFFTPDYFSSASSLNSAEDIVAPWIPSLPVLAPT